ncbi:hypothetical protein BN946_scf184470.g18 [Trametes cinnabarina]|uniref:Uncharacterized protein n=1 Tax=Pycnoporus cinnabarinus TaxID=5643 RepID=A0A060SPG1_PYCCI|nr:hypothetical protein BN946_scf184470.g18 [Trametes cinnabarina]
MLSRLGLSFLLLLLLPILSAHLALGRAASELRIAHRILHPSLPATPFLDRATVLLSGSGPTADARLVPSQTFADDLLDYTRTAQGLNDALYQVALEHPGDSDQSQWAVSSVLACHLPTSSSESFTIHLDQNGRPFSFEYFVGPIPHDGACPKRGRKTGRGSSAQSSPAEFRAIANTTVALRSPSFPPLPELRVPPPVTAEGKPVEAPKEKSFIEKYWMYIAIALIAMTFAPSPSEEASEGGHGQGSGERR